MRYIPKTIAVLVAGLILAGMAWLGIMIGDRSMPVKDVKMTLAPVVAQGTNMQINIKVDYLRSCQTDIVRVTYDAQGRPYVVPELILPAGRVGWQDSTSVIAVSDTFPLGEGTYVSHPYYACNWFQRAFWPIAAPERVAKFTVVPKDSVLQ